MAESARGDYAGYTQDCLELTTDWGFALADVAVPVHLAHGTADRIVPFSHGRYLERALPDATLSALPGGHISILPSLVELARELGAAR